MTVRNCLLLLLSPSLVLGHPCLKSCLASLILARWCRIEPLRALRARLAPGGKVIVSHPLHIFYSESLRKYTGGCVDGFTIGEQARLRGLHAGRDGGGAARRGLANGAALSFGPKMTAMAARLVCKSLRNGSRRECRMTALLWATEVLVTGEVCAELLCASPSRFLPGGAAAVAGPARV